MISDIVQYKIEELIKRPSLYQYIYIDIKEMGTFYIELKPNVVDKVAYKTKVDTNDPCNDILLTEVKQNDMASPYDDKAQSWLFKK